MAGKTKYVYTMTITQAQQRPTRKGVTPAVETMTTFQAIIDSRKVSKLVALATAEEKDEPEPA